MVLTKRHILRIVFASEVLIFVGMYLLSPHGVRALRSMQKENEQVAVKIAELQKELQTLEAEVAEWDNNSFYKEKIAREQLQMAKSSDEVYFL